MILCVSFLILGKLRSFKEIFPESEEVSPENLMKQLCCTEAPDEDCFFTSCPVCNSKMEAFKEKLKSLLIAENVEEVEFHQWAFTDNAQKEFHVMSTENFCSEFIHMMNAFKTHHYVNKMQSIFTYQLKKNLQNGEALVMMDFAENYSIKTQNEVQQAYFKPQQVSILTIYVYIQVEDQLKEQSFVCLTDDTRNAKTPTVYTGYKKLQVLLDEMFPRRIFTNILTDGCAGISICSPSFCIGFAIDLLLICC